MRRFFLENMGFKAASLLTAFLLWAYVGTTQMLERRENVQVEFSGIPAGLSLGPGAKSQVKVLLHGRNEPTRQLNPDDLKAVVSFPSGAKAGEDLLVTPRIRNLPKGVTAEVPSITVRLVAIAEPEKK
jgi:hypothetical protein